MHFFAYEYIFDILLKKCCFFVFNFLIMRVSKLGMNTHTHEYSTHIIQKRVLDPQALELQAIVSYLIWVLATESGTF